jgi:membrane protein DedA with SNARE-associated domain
MLDTIAELPFWQAFAVLFVSVLARSNGTYWIGRGARAGWQRYRGTHRDQTARAEVLLQSLGPVAVALSYLTIGIQTAIHLTAGVMRMPLRWYLPAAVVGSTAWAALYATIGLAAVQAWIAAEAGSWNGVAALVAVVALSVGASLLLRRRARQAADDPRHLGPRTVREPDAS